jgi:aminoglycoside 6'-N-acetyltransferase I
VIDVRIRAAGVSDLTGISALASAFYAEEGFATPESELRVNLGVLLTSDGARTAVADHRDNEIVGFAITTLKFGLEQGLVAELEDLFVQPDHRRTGIGNALIHDGARWARLRGCRTLELVVAPNGNDVSHLFDYYAQRGFADEGRRLLSRSLIP